MTNHETSPYERRCRLLLRAYPPRYRATRAEELLATLLDCAAPGQKRPSLAESWDIVRGGLHARRRDRPPFLHWLAYRLGEKRVPYPYRYWVRDDAMGRFAYFRQSAGNIIPFQIFWIFTPTLFVAVADHRFELTTWEFGGHIRPYLVFIALCVVVPIPFAQRARRKRILKKHGFAENGTPLDGLPPIEITPQGWRYRA